MRGHLRIPHRLAYGSSIWESSSFSENNLWLTVAVVLSDQILLSLRPCLRWLRKFGQRDEWRVVPLTAIKMAETRSNDDTTSTAESHSNLQSEGGPCRAEEIGRAHV